ncbi:multidrug effflux MFS transporter [Pokkaliibacter sp. MBI-7]|uniref:multidrug effflux MFS transporter n=1 Tax=Pokkaliibacter sp. MBI-7 TaxID=3040600 RepID=UPI00244A8B9F|nr:multidrug effflux MFS transporter [Pokkaliibacter sp. MBI-7]MDH2435533.1 multidrug effflux MFS transporter [Pokkaliibacter sp. MBI-7]
MMNTWILTLVLAGLTMIGPFATDTFLPSFPAIANQFSISMTQVQQSLSVYLLAFSAMSLFYGTLSDSFGRRPVILGSLILFTLASVGAALSPSFEWLLVCRVLQGLSAGGGLVISFAITRDRFSGAEAQKLMSHIMMVFGLAPAVAPIAGGFLQQHFGWQSGFYFMALIGALLLLSSVIWLQESLPEAARTPFHPTTLTRNYLTALTHPQFLFRALAYSAAFGGMAIYISAAASFVMDILHKPETAFAWLFVPMIGGMILGSATNARLAHRVSSNSLLALGLGAMAVATLANVTYNRFFAAELPWVVLPIMLYTFGLGLALPIMSMKTLDIFPSLRGLSSSLLNFFQMLVFSLISGIVVPLVFSSALLIACAMLGCMLVALLCWGIALFLSRRH